MCVPMLLGVCVGVIMLAQAHAHALPPYEAASQASLVVAVAIAIAFAFIIAWRKCCCQLVTNVFVALRTIDKSTSWASQATHAEDYACLSIDRR